MYSTRFAVILFCLLALVILVALGGCPSQPKAGKGIMPPTAPGEAGPTSPAGAGKASDTTGTQSSAGPSSSASSEAAGQDFSDIKLEMADGTTKTIGDFAGKVLVLDFWATFCKPCIKKLPEFQDLQEELSDSVLIVAVTLDPDVQTAVGWAKANNMTLPIASFSEELKQAFFPGEETIAIPQTRILDREGKLVSSFGPQASFVDIEKAVRELAARSS